MLEKRILRDAEGMHPQCGRPQIDVTLMGKGGAYPLRTNVCHAKRLTRKSIVHY